jgi:integrase
MKRKLSDRVIDRLKPHATRPQYDIFDEKQTGLGLCYSNGGARTWFIFWRDSAGEDHRMSFGRYDKGMKTAEAKAAAETKLKAIRAGVAPVKGEPILGELVERYKKHAQARMAASSFKQISSNLKLGITSHPELCAKKLSEVTREQLEDLHGEVGRTRGKYAANHLVKVLRTMFGLARDWHMCSGDNPCRVGFFKVTGRERFLSMGELRRLNAALLADPDWRWRAFFPLLLSLGLRKSELLGLPWDRVDFEAKTLRLSRTKNGKPLMLPLSDSIISRLKELPSYGTSQFVFTGNRDGNHLKSPGYAWERIRERAGLEDVRIHDLRHSFASFLLAAGNSLPMISKALNHSSLAMTQRYAHLQIDALRAPLDSHAALMLGVTESPSAGEAPNAVAER